MQTYRMKSPFAFMGCAITVIALFASLALPAGAQTTNAPDRTGERIASAMTGLHRFTSSHSLDDLTTTSRMLFSAYDRTTVQQRDLPARRRSVMAAYAQLVRQIELAHDPTFDPKDPKNIPMRCLIPPREPSGRQLPSCADPNDIPDLGVRLKYVAAINANTQLTQRYNHYRLVQNLDDETMQGLQLILQIFHSNTPADTAALDNIFRQAGVSDARRAKIKPMF